MERSDRAREVAPHSLRSALRLAHRLSDDVAHLGAYALTNQSRAEAAAHEIVEAFERLVAEARNADEIRSLAITIIDGLMRLKRLLSTPATLRIVPEAVRSGIFEQMHQLDAVASHLLRSRASAAAGDHS